MTGSSRGETVRACAATDPGSARALKNTTAMKQIQRSFAAPRRLVERDEPKPLHSPEIVVQRPE